MTAKPAIMALAFGLALTVPLAATGEPPPGKDKRMTNDPRKVPGTI